MGDGQLLIKLTPLDLKTMRCIKTIVNQFYSSAKIDKTAHQIVAALR